MKRMWLSVGLIAAVVLISAGELLMLTKIKNDSEDYDYTCCIKDALEGLNIPVMYDIQSGHGQKIMTLPMGAVCKMDTAAGTIKFEG